MGGIVCNIHKNAIITDPNSDAQWRALFSITDVAQAVANDTGSADKLCAILAQAAFSPADKKWMATLVESLWAAYS
jgi:uncharacterized membrane-anchored protein